MAKLFVKKGDEVLVLTGKDKGKTAKVLETSPKSGKVVLDGVNIATKHKKPKSQEDKGGIVKINAPLEISNVMVICPDCKKATRVKHACVSNKKVRACAKCGASLDKEFAKKTKKANKEVKKLEEKPKAEKVVEKTTKTAAAEKPATAKPATAKTTKHAATKPAATKTAATKTAAAKKPAAAKTAAEKPATAKTAATKSKKSASNAESK